MCYNRLKDSFNLRWPDYVYKRRPNNSRKKRRAIPNTDSPVVEDASRRDSEGADNDAYGENSGGDDAEGSPSLVVRLPHDRDDSQHRIGINYGSGPPAPGDPRANPPPPNGPIGSRMPYPPNAPQGSYGYEDQYNQYSYYPNNGSSQPTNRLPPVWNQHDASRSPYEGPRSASTGYSPVGEGDQQWSTTTRPGGNPSPITPSWQNPPMHGQPQAGPMSSARALPRTSADNSPVQPSSDLGFRGGNRPPPTPQGAGGRPFQTLNAPMYPPSASTPHGQRGSSPPSYGGAYPYAPQGAASAPPTAGNGVGRSPVLPAIASLDHSYGAHQQSSNMRGDAGYSLPPLGGPGDSGSRAAQNPPYPGSRDLPGADVDRTRGLSGAQRQTSGDLDRTSRPDGREPAANGLSGLGGSHHQAYWDPVKAEAGE